MRKIWRKIKIDKNWIFLESSKSTMLLRPTKTINTFLACFRRKFAIVTTNLERPKPMKKEKEGEEGRGRGGRKLIVSFLWLEYESRIRVENVGEGRRRREQERKNRECIGPGLDRLHPCHLPERGYVFSTCSIETESWIQRIGTIPRTRSSFVLLRIFFLLRFFANTRSSYKERSIYKSRILFSLKDAGE